MSRPATLPNTIATQPAGNIAASLFDANWTALKTAYDDGAIGYVNYGADSGATNSYVVTCGGTFSSYLVGMTVAFVPANSNTGGSAINVNGLGSKTILNQAGLALTPGAITGGVICVLVYNGASFLITSFAPTTGTNTIGTNTTLNCAGASSVTAYYVVTATLGITLANLATGTPVTVVLFNNTGAGKTITLDAYSPVSATHFNWNIKQAGGTVLNGTGNLPLSIAANTYVSLSLGSVGNSPAVMVGSLT
jgi:hypothetical protein